MGTGGIPPTFFAGAVSLLPPAVAVASCAFAAATCDADGTGGIPPPPTLPALLPPEAEAPVAAANCRIAAVSCACVGMGGCGVGAVLGLAAAEVALAAVANWFLATASCAADGTGGAAAGGAFAPNDRVPDCPVVEVVDAGAAKRVFTAEDGLADDFAALPNPALPPPPLSVVVAVVVVVVCARGTGFGGSGEEAEGGGVMAEGRGSVRRQCLPPL